MLSFLTLLSPAFATTFHKSQGLTLERVGVDLRNQSFLHGMTYGAVKVNLTGHRRKESTAGTAGCAAPGARKRASATMPWSMASSTFLCQISRS